MDWQDEGVVLGTRKHGETSAIVELMTRAHGRHLGLVRGGRSRRMQPVLQAGNKVTVSWRARLDEHLGQYTIEPEQLRAAQLMESSTGIYGVQTLASHLRLLPERDAHSHLYKALNVILSNLGEPAIAGELLVRFEMALLEDLGFGLDLTQCAGGGSAEKIIYVSPKSGRGVSDKAGAPWADKLLKLPMFLRPQPAITDAGASSQSALASAQSIEDGFALTQYFFERHVYEPRGIEPPRERVGFIAAIKKAIAASDAIESGNKGAGDKNE